MAMGHLLPVRVRERADGSAEECPDDKAGHPQAATPRAGYGGAAPGGGGSPVSPGGQSTPIPTVRCYCSSIVPPTLTFRVLAPASTAGGATEAASIARLRIIGTGPPPPVLMETSTIR